MRTARACVPSPWLRRSCKHTPLKSIELALRYGPPAKERIAGSACPACNPLLAPVARRLPSCRRTKSRLICGWVRQATPHLTARYFTAPYFTAPHHVLVAVVKRVRGSLHVRESLSHCTRPA